MSRSAEPLLFGNVTKYNNNYKDMTSLKPPTREHHRYICQRTPQIGTIRQAQDSAPLVPCRKSRKKHFCSFFCDFERFQHHNHPIITFCQESLRKQTLQSHVSLHFTFDESAVRLKDHINCLNPESGMRGFVIK